jgi:8-oxo-dGTP diphosphatase
MTPIIVTAAVVERDGRFLITRRPKGVHLEGVWEFPGGKCDVGEALDLCLARELREELDVEGRIGSEIFTTTHIYPDRAVELHFFQCDLHGEPRPQLGQELQWVPREALAAFEFPPADAELIRMLQRLKNKSR